MGLGQWLPTYNMDFMWFLAFIKRIFRYSTPLVAGVNAFAGDPAVAGVIPVASISTFTSLSAVEGTLPVAIQYTLVSFLLLKCPFCYRPSFFPWRPSCCS